METGQPDLIDVSIAVRNALNDQFILTATEYGVSRWEKLLNIIPKATYSLDERKLAILARLNEQLPFTYRALERILSELCGADSYELELYNDIYKLVVIIELTAKNTIEVVEDVLKRIVPANMLVKYVIRVVEEYTTPDYDGAAIVETIKEYLFDEVEIVSEITTAVYAGSATYETI